jgi:hypothetical protein
VPRFSSFFVWCRLFDNIRGGEVKWTAKIDAPSRDFIAALLAINEQVGIESA